MTSVSILVVIMSKNSSDIAVSGANKVFHVRMFSLKKK